MQTASSACRTKTAGVRSVGHCRCRHPGVDMQIGSALICHHHGFFGARPCLLGSGHVPNIEAVEFIVRKLAPANARVVFLIVGAVALLCPGRFPPTCSLRPRRRRRQNVLLAVATWPESHAFRRRLEPQGSAYMAARLRITTPIGIRGMT
jgi:hypothetical protein